LQDRYALNANGNFSHSRKELLIHPVKDGPFAAMLPSAPDQLWLTDKSPDVQIWSAKVNTPATYHMFILASTNIRQAQDAMIQHNLLLAGCPVTTPHASHAAEAAESLHLVRPTPETTNAASESPGSKTADSQKLSQKDFATALCISQARVSQLVKIGMPLSSISAAQEWRMKQQRATKDACEVVESAATPSPPDKQKDQVVCASAPLRSPTSCLPPPSQLHPPLHSTAASHSSNAVAEISIPKQPVSREQLESLTTLELRELCKPRGLKVCGFKNDLVFRLLFSYASDALVSGNHELLTAFSNGDLQRICRQRGLSTSGTSNDMILRLAEPVCGTTSDDVMESRELTINQRHSPPPDSSIAARTAAVAAGVSLHAPATSADLSSAPSSLLFGAAAAASTHIASTSSSSSSASLGRSISRVLPKANLRPSSILRASSSSLDAELPLKRAIHAKLAQPVLLKSLPRAQAASLDLYFPVPIDPVVSVTAPILVDTYSDSVSGTDFSPFILIENAAPSPVRTFPPFVLPPPPRTFTQAAHNQRLPAGLGLSSCVAMQHAPRNSILITSLPSLYTLPGTTSVFLVSPPARANCVVFLFQKAAVHTI
jgi:hypothetical protein